MPIRWLQHIDACLAECANGVHVVFIASNVPRRATVMTLSICIGSCSEEHTTHVTMSSVGSNVKSRTTIGRCETHIGASTNQGLYHLEVTLLTRNPECGGAIYKSIDVDATSLKEEVDCIMVTTGSGGVEKVKGKCFMLGSVPRKGIVRRRRKKAHFLKKLMGALDKTPNSSEGSVQRTDVHWCGTGWKLCIKRRSMRK